jgi:hypothetical protein
VVDGSNILELGQLHEPVHNPEIIMLLIIFVFVWLKYRHITFEDI